MSKGIRRYGPGKFNTILDSIVHAMTLDGTSESCGDVSEVGFYASKVDLGPDSVEDAEKTAEELKDGSSPLTDDEKDRLRESIGAIVVESEQGFVTVDYYDNQKEFDKDWAEVEDDASSSEDEEDEEEEEEEEAEAEAETESTQEEGE